MKTSAKEQPQRSFGGFSWLQGRSRVWQASNHDEVGSGLVWGILTLMLVVVVNLVNTNLCKNPEKMPETLAHWYSPESTQRKLSNEYQPDWA